MLIYSLFAPLFLRSKKTTEEQLPNTEIEIESSMHDDFTSLDSKQSRAEYLPTMI